MQIFSKFFLSPSTQALTNLTITKNTRIFNQMRKFTLLRETPALWDAPFAIPSGSFFETENPLWEQQIIIYQ
jgi:hypothetical protein